jgi:hypothetical protein
MRKFLALLLAASVLCYAGVGCGKKDDKKKKDDSAAKKDDGKKKDK